jgi:cytochrome c556
MKGWMGAGLVAGIAAGLLLAGTMGSSVAQMKGDPIKERVGLMKSISKANKVLGACAKKSKCDKMAVSAAAKTISASADKFVMLFPKGTSSADMKGKTRAKADIWAKWSDFEKANAALKAAADKVASAGDAAAMKAAAGGMGKACGGCHKPFRGPKPKG